MQSSNFILFWCHRLKKHPYQNNSLNDRLLSQPLGLLNEVKGKELLNFLTMFLVACKFKAGSFEMPVSGDYQDTQVVSYSSNVFA